MSRTKLESGLLSLIRLLSTRRSARLVYRYAQQLYPGAEARRRRQRFYLRSLVSLRSSTEWFDLLDAHDDLRLCRRHEPELVERIHRPYRRASLKLKQRLHLLLEHVRVSDQVGLSGLMAEAYAGPTEIARFADRTGQTLQLQLGRPAQFGKEGELALHISDGENRLYSASFAFRESGAGRELDVGCIQGPAVEDARQAIRDLTRNLHGLRPRSLILEALRAIAASAGCARLRVVGNNDHIYRSLRKRRKIAFDYDGFCAEIEGVAADGTDWLLPLEAEVRPLSEVPSKKRAEATRRRNLVEDIGNQIKSNLGARSASRRRGA